MKTLVAVATLALLAIAAPTQAQGDPQGVILTVTSAGTIAPMGSGSIGFTLDVGCAELVDPTADVTIEVTDAQAWFNATPPAIELSFLDCDPATGRATTEGEVPFTVSAAAPAVVQHTVHLTAMVGSTASATDPAATYTVAYKSDYSLTPSVQFPLTVTNKTTTFTATGVQASNAMSMIMVDSFGCDSGALISGIGPLQYANKAGAPDTKTYTVTFTAPTEDWEKATCTLKVFGHFNFDGNAGDPTDQKTLSWEFVNGGVPHEHDGDGKKSPAPVGVVIALGLLAFAALRRRRDD
jgi:MYXO-CTERM domain-containing protein